MKKNLIILCAVLLASAFTACSARPEKVCYLVGYGDGSSVTYEPQITIPQWSGGSFKSGSAKEEAGIEFDGVYYEGKYKQSKYVGHNSFAIDYYVTENLFSFGLNAETGKLVYLEFAAPEYIENEISLDDVENVEIATKEIAEGYLSEFADLSAYTEQDFYARTIDTDGNGEAEMTLFTYAFVRKVNGMNSSDGLSITVSSKGHLINLAVGDVGAFSSIPDEELESFASVDADNMIMTALAEKAPELKNPKFEGAGYAVTPEGELVLMARCSGSMEDYDVGLEFMIK